MVKILLSAVGFLLIILLCAEEFRNFLRQIWQRLTVRPWMKYLAYPLAAVLALTAAGLILFALWAFLSTTFSYD